jgi:nucleotide-binding universal stress UspA family protein
MKLAADSAHRETVLVPIDGSEGSLAAVAEVIRRARHSSGAHVNLLNVQPQVLTTEILAHLPPEVGDAYYARLGGEALSRAQSMLADAGIPHAACRLVGPVVQTILEQCEALRCDSIVMGTHGRAALLGGLMGSVATGVVHLAQVPVTLVKAPKAAGGGQAARRPSARI